jgi:hypothetical protein
MSCTVFFISLAVSIGVLAALAFTSSGRGGGGLHIPPRPLPVRTPSWDDVPRPEALPEVDEPARIMARADYDNYYHKIPADISPELWERIWLKGYRSGKRDA